MKRENSFYQLRRSFIDVSAKEIYLFIYFSWYNCVYHASINNARNRSFMIWHCLCKSLVFFSCVSCVAHFPSFSTATFAHSCAFQINNDKIIINYFAIFRIISLPLILFSLYLLAAGLPILSPGIHFVISSDKAMLYEVNWLSLAGLDTDMSSC